MKPPCRSNQVHSMERDVSSIRRYKRRCTVSATAIAVSLLAATAPPCHAFVSSFTTQTTQYPNIGSRTSSTMLQAQTKRRRTHKNTPNNNNNKNGAPPNSDNARQPPTNNNNHIHRNSIPSTRAHDQFKPKYLEYQDQTSPGRLIQPPTPTNMDDEPSKFVPLESTAQAPSQKEQDNLTDKIAHLLSEETDDEADYDAFGNVADRETVFAKLSDEDRSRATFAVSKAANHDYHSVEEPIRNKKGKRIITANVFESGQDTIKEYVKSLGQHQVLSKEDEMVLGRQIQTLAKWEEQRQLLEETLLRAPTFTEWADAVQVTVVELKKQVRRSQKAKAALVEANLRLVVTVARQTVKAGRTEINFQDACQEGILGLARACEKFDPDRGFRFSSYAVWWIKKMIHQNVSEQSRTVRLPANVIRKINDIRIHEKVLMDELGRKPKDEEIAEKVNMSVEQLTFYRKSANSVESLDKKITFSKQSDNAGNNPDQHDMVEDVGQSPEGMVNKQMLKDDIGRLIQTLSPREQAVIRLRFGLDNGTPRTLDDIGKKFKVDKEVIRKLEAKALRKLRQPYRNQNLKCYVSDL